MASGKQRVVLVTGGMGGLGETISTKMAEAGYRVCVTYSPGNAKHAEWVAQMKQNGYDIFAVACDVADFDSCARAVADVPGAIVAAKHTNAQAKATELIMIFVNFVFIVIVLSV